MRQFEARDTLSVDLTRADDAALAVLRRVTWEPGAFTVRAEATPGAAHDARVTFPSPPVEGEAGDATVTLRWYAARNGDGTPKAAPAVLVVHTLHPDMAIGKAIARSFAKRGLHAFLVELPGYGARREAGRVPGVVALHSPARTVVEVRRARDAIATLPNVADGRIALQGTSLGGFAGAVAASMDGAFDPVVLLLSGADAFGVLRDGQADASRLRRLAHAAGHSDAELRRVLDRLDPQHVAHRLDPKRTWLFTARRDQVVPARNSDLLARTIDLPPAHHVTLDGGHYTAMLTLPGLVERMADIIRRGNPAGGS